MSDKALSTDDAQEHALLRAIASRDRPMTARLLAESPLLALRAVKAGATREEARAYHFDEIGHYVYAGDTALHVAAVAYERDIAEELLSKGAPETDVAPNRSITRSMGCRGRMRGASRGSEYGTRRHRLRRFARRTDGNHPTASGPWRSPFRQELGG